MHALLLMLPGCNWCGLLVLVGAVDALCRTHDAKVSPLPTEVARAVLSRAHNSLKRFLGVSSWSDLSGFLLRLYRELGLAGRLDFLNVRSIAKVADGPADEPGCNNVSYDPLRVAA